MAEASHNTAASEAGMALLTKQVGDLDLDEGYLSSSATTNEDGPHAEADEIIRQVYLMIPHQLSVC